MRLFLSFLFLRHNGSGYASVTGIKLKRLLFLGFFKNKFFVPGFQISIELFLRRTPVRSFHYAAKNRFLLTPNMPFIFISNL